MTAFLSLLVLTALPSTADQSDVDLGGVRSIDVVRTGSDTLDVALDIRTRYEPPGCKRLDRDAVKVAAIRGARAGNVDAGGAGWTWRASDGFPVPTPERVCKPAVVHLDDVVGASVHVELADAHRSWSIDLAVPPIPACRWVDPKDGRVVHGQRVRAACAVDDLAAVGPWLFLMRGPNPTGTRPALEFAGNEVAFVVPDDWSLGDKDVRVRVYFSKTRPSVVGTTAPVTVNTSEKPLLRNYSDLPLRRP